MLSCKFKLDVSKLSKIEEKLPKKFRKGVIENVFVYDIKFAEKVWKR